MRVRKTISVFSAIFFELIIDPMNYDLTGLINCVSFLSSHFILSGHFVRGFFSSVECGSIPFLGNSTFPSLVMCLVYKLGGI